MISGLMGRVGKGDHGWTSRDYNISVPCFRLTCPANSQHVCASSAAHPICVMPSAIKIGANGICKTGQDLIDAKPPVTPKKIDGD